MGELKNDNRLIRRQSGSSVRDYSFTPWAKNAAYLGVDIEDALLLAERTEI